MKKIMKKLRSRKGESLIEVLCAILIFTMSSVGMYSMVMAANNINAAAKEADRANQEAMAIVEKAEGDPTSKGSITVTVTDSAGNKEDVKIPVDIYESGDLFSFFRQETGG